MEDKRVLNAMEERNKTKEGATTKVYQKARSNQQPARLRGGLDPKDNPSM